MCVGARQDVLQHGEMRTGIMGGTPLEPHSPPTVDGASIPYVRLQHRRDVLVYPTL
jgi:hypothetical protein